MKNTGAENSREERQGCDMKKVKIGIIVLVCIGVVVGAYYYITDKSSAKSEENVQLTEVQEVITKDLEKNYPATPREVVKLYNRIITCFYNEQYTDEELLELGDQARLLFDKELLDNNPRNDYFDSLKADIEDYHEKQKTIASSAVDSSNDVEYRTVDGDECAYVEASYFIKEGSAYSRTYQMYVLRKDTDGNWKILVFYQVDGNATDEE